jgi:hypothetical protein
MLEQLQKESFQECINQSFQVVQPQMQGFALQLTEVTEQVRTPRQEAFSVVFRGPADRYMPQGTYHLINATLGGIDIFLVPIAQDNEGFQYEAVFNRLIPSS